ncbi:hypothetical protein D3C87_1922080 [compost metagenome]
MNPPNVYGYGHKAYYDHVVHAITTKSKALVEGEDGRRSLELIHAIYESVEQKKEITYPFESKACKLGR